MRRLINGLVDDVPVEKISEFEKGLLEYAETTARDVLDEIVNKKELDVDLMKADILDVLKRLFA